MWKGAIKPQEWINYSEKSNVQKAQRLVQVPKNKHKKKWNNTHDYEEFTLSKWNAYGW